MRSSSDGSRLIGALRGRSLTGRGARVCLEIGADRDFMTEERVNRREDD